MSELRKKGMRKMLSRGGKAKMKDISSRAISDGVEVETETQKRGKLKHKKSFKLFQSKEESKASKTKDKSKIELMASETETKSPARKSPMTRIRHKIRKSLSKKKNKGSSRITRSTDGSNFSISADETKSLNSLNPNLGSSSSPLKPVAEKSFTNTSGSGGLNLKTSNYSATSPPTDATLSLTSKSGISTQFISQDAQSVTHLPRSPTDTSNSDVITSNSSRNGKSESTGEIALISSAPSEKPALSDASPTPSPIPLATSTYTFSTTLPADDIISLTGQSENYSVDEPTSTEITSQQTQSTTLLPPSPTEVSNIDAPVEISANGNIESTEGMSLNSVGLSGKTASSDNCLTSSMSKIIKNEASLVKACNGEKEVLEKSTTSIDVVPICSTSINVFNDDVNSTTSSVCSIPVIDQMEILDAIAPQSTEATIQGSPASSVFVSKDDQDSSTGEDDQDSLASSVFIEKNDVKSTTSSKRDEYATDSISVTNLVGRSGMALFGKKNPKWYPCLVKNDNMDGTIKIQWEEDKTFTKRLPVENFRLNSGI